MGGGSALREKLYDSAFAIFTILATPFGLLLGGGELVIQEAELFAVHCPSPSLRSQSHYPGKGLGFPESP